MRPRSRLLSKRRLLLPTIKEGTEEAVKDLNEANTLHIVSHGSQVSSEDYLLSICHLAHPTFPTRDVSPPSRHSRPVDAVNQRLRLSRLTAPSGNLEIKGETPAMDLRLEEEKELDAELVFGNSDPLEYLYGHQNHISGGVRREVIKGRFTKQGQARSRAHSIPRASSPDLPRQRKSSLPELHAHGHASFPNITPKHSMAMMQARVGSPADRGAEGDEQSPNKQSLISQWISDCRSAWKEARARACMLPAIAEV